MLNGTIRTLKEARDLVEKGWCQGHRAETKSGRLCFHDDTLAVKWCATGALMKASNQLGDMADFASAVDAMRRVVGDHIVAFNDAPTTTLYAVLIAFDAAIAAETKDSGAVMGQ